MQRRRNVVESDTSVRIFRPFTVGRAVNYDPIVLRRRLFPVPQRRYRQNSCPGCYHYYTKSSEVSRTSR